MTRPRARDEQRHFELHELFFSRTDEKGIIRSGNDVFVRISGYRAAELVGANHNLVRHPAMPRAVFRLLWDRLHAGLPVAAYVRNLAHDGSHYWVMATVVPVPGGHLSIRMKPTSELFAAAAEMYGEVRAHEERVEGGEPRRRKAAIAAGVKRLGELLAAAGFESYEAFMHAALPVEVLGREQQLTAPAQSEPADGVDERLAAVLEACRGTDATLDGLVGGLRGYAELGAGLGEKSRFLERLAEEVRLCSLNAILAAARMSRNGAALGAVAQLMRGRSDATAPLIGELRAALDRSVGRLRALAFHIAVARLQTETTTRFVGELIAGTDPGHDVHGDLAALAAALAAGATRLVDTIADVTGGAEVVTRDVGTLQSELRVLRALELNAQVEAARTADADAVRALFAEIGEQVRLAQDQLVGFERLRELAGEPARDARAVRDRTGEIGRRVALVAA